MKNIVFLLASISCFLLSSSVSAIPSLKTAESSAKDSICKMVYSEYECGHGPYYCSWVPATGCTFTQSVTSSNLNDICGTPDLTTRSKCTQKSPYCRWDDGKCGVQKKTSAVKKQAKNVQCKKLSGKDKDSCIQAYLDGCQWVNDQKSCFAFY